MRRNAEVRVRRRRTTRHRLVLLLTAVCVGIGVGVVTYLWDTPDSATTITLASYRSVTVTVRAPAGSAGLSHNERMLLADTTPLIVHGLTGVTDTSLGGHDGMLFAFARPTTVSFWMKNTSLPLSVVFVRPDGILQPAIAMAPCGDSDACPTYAPLAAYSFALEVPQGRADALGLVPGASLKVSF